MRRSPTRSPRNRLLAASPGELPPPKPPPDWRLRRKQPRRGGCRPLGHPRLAPLAHQRRQSGCPG
eukprot:6230936-Alexandrium_andersonii.AAC.1